MGARPLTVCAAQNVCACGGDPAANVFLEDRIPVNVCALTSVRKDLSQLGGISMRVGMSVRENVCATTSVRSNVCSGAVGSPLGII